MFEVVKRKSFLLIMVMLNIFAKEALNKSAFPRKRIVLIRRVIRDIIQKERIERTSVARRGQIRRF